MRSAVLFMVFNRPEPTGRTFEQIRKARPGRLYVAMDGPRFDHDSDVVRCKEVKDIVSAVDWPCKVSYLFRETNLGCRLAVQKAINWFFESETEGVILEDDCLPNADFFEYCDWGLENYRLDKRVWQISGNNFHAPPSLFEERFSFVPLAQIWGWATWRDRWNKYTGNPFYLEERSRGKDKYWEISRRARINKKYHMQRLRQGLDTWDYQWQVTILNHRGLCLVSRANLISNIGDGADATHTKKDQRSRLPTEGIECFGNAPNVMRGAALTKWYERMMGLRSLRGAANAVTEKVSRELRIRGKSIMASLLFRNVPKVIIASTGRAGSTVLFNAIAEGLIRARFGVETTSRIGRVLRRVASGFVDRLKDIEKCKFPIIKTHDVFAKEMAACGRYFFVFGDPLESIASVDRMVRERGRVWLDEHVYHLRGEGTYDELYSKDILNYEGQIRSWVGINCPSILVIDYDSMWEEERKISGHCGYSVRLPPRRERTSDVCQKKYDTELFERLQRIREESRRCLWGNQPGFHP